MSETRPSIEPQAPRRPFSSRYAHRGWGLTLVICGSLFALSSLLNVLIGLGLAMPNDVVVDADSPVSTAQVGIGFAILSALAFFFNLALVAWGIYLLRGQGDSPAAVARKEAAERRRAEDLKRREEAATQRAAQASEALRTRAAAVATAVGGAALVAYRQLESTAKGWYPQDHAARMTEALDEAGVDLSKLRSPRIGYVETLTPGVSIEIFRDWVIRGNEAHDVDASTQGLVHTDGSIQISSTRDKNNRVVERRHDLRIAEIQLIGSGWSISDRIHPDHAIHAKKLIAELSNHVDTLKSRGLTQADLREMVDTILNNTGQPPAEKLKQLSNLRFDRLLSDEEYEQAKSKILGIN